MPKPNTFFQLYIHVIFAVKGRANVVRETHRDQVQKSTSRALSIIVKTECWQFIVCPIIFTFY